MRGHFSNRKSRSKCQGSHFFFLLNPTSVWEFWPFLPELWKGTPEIVFTYTWPCLSSTDYMVAYVKRIIKPLCTTSSSSYLSFLVWNYLDLNVVFQKSWRSVPKKTLWGDITALLHTAHKFHSEGRCSNIWLCFTAFREWMASGLWALPRLPRLRQESLTA